MITGRSRESSGEKDSGSVIAMGKTRRKVDELKMKAAKEKEKKKKKNKNRRPTRHWAQKKSSIISPKINLRRWPNGSLRQ